MNAPHFIFPWPKWAQWFCGVLGHKDRNYSSGKAGSHYAYCLRCGVMFGNEWGRPQFVSDCKACDGRGYQFIIRGAKPEASALPATENTKTPEKGEASR